MCFLDPRHAELTGIEQRFLMGARAIHGNETLAGGRLSAHGREVFLMSRETSRRSHPLTSSVIRMPPISCWEPIGMTRSFPVTPPGKSALRGDYLVV